MTVRPVIGTRGAQQQPPQQQPLPPRTGEWKAMALQRLGWKSRTNEQQTIHAELSETTQRILNSQMRGQGEHSAQATQKLVDGAGEEFRLYHELRGQFERAENRTPEMVAALKEAAQGYIDRFNKHDRRRRNDKTNIAKKDACEATIAALRKFEMAHQFEDLGDPPWDSAQSMRAASIRTSLSLDSLPPGEQHAERLGAQTSSPTFWVNQRNDRGGRDKTYLLKPESLTVGGGMPDGGEPPRELVSARLADMLNGTLGMSLSVPETQVVTLGPERFPPDVLQRLRNDRTIHDQPEYAGSVQQFERADGDMRDMSIEQLRQIPPREVQQLAIFDTIALNGDRHGGNIMFRRDGDNPPTLVPIDHGMTFLDRSGGDRIARQMGGEHNVLLSMASSHEPFDEDSLAGIARLDPDAMALALKRERATMERANPTTAGKLSDEAIELSRRAAMFLKRAAPELPPAAVQMALARFNPELFDPDLDMRGFDELADRIIAKIKPDVGAIKELFLMPKDQRTRMEESLRAQGWQVSSVGNNVLIDPATALKLWKSGTVATPITPDPNIPETDLNPGTDAELLRMREVFPRIRQPRNDGQKCSQLSAWREWQRLGMTMNELRETMDTAILRGRGKVAAQESVIEAVEAIKRARALRDAMANDTNDPVVGGLRHDVAFLEEMLPLLDTGVRGDFGRALEDFRQQLDGGPLSDGEKDRIRQSLSRAKIPIVDTARNRLLNKLTELLEAEPPGPRKTRMENIKGGVREFSVLEGYRQLVQLVPDATNL